MLETPNDRLAEWLSVPSTQRSEDPRFEVKQARAEDFERVYACVDESFGGHRPPALFDWLYRKNPYGHAQVWYVEEIATGRMIKSISDFPWPAYFNETPRSGSFGGDGGTVPDWQRKGLTRIERSVRNAHPWHPERIEMGAPNQATLAVQNSRGREHRVRGMLPGGVALLRGGALLHRSGIPSWLANPLGTVAGVALDRWQRLTLSRSRNLRFESLNAFYSDLDTVTWETTRFSHYWCPHSAEWLNWRYLDHPSETYSAFALLDHPRDQPLGYSVLRLAGEQATLCEFAASTNDAPALLHHTVAAARSAGCSYVNTFHPPQWRHWALLRRAGFLPYRTNNFFAGADNQNEERSLNFDRWQITPGDRDVH